MYKKYLASARNWPIIGPARPVYGLKIALVILLTSLTSLSTKANYFQKATIKASNLPLQDVFNELRKQTGYHFLYAVEDLKKAHNVTLNFQDVWIDEILQYVFINQPLTYKIENNRVLVAAKPTPVAGKTIQNAVQGKITDSQGNPLSNVTVSVKGTAQATSSKADGTFQLAVNQDRVVLSFSIIGFKSKDINTVAGSTLEVTLEEAFSDLEEVVVTGYSSQSKRDITGSVAIVKTEELKAVPAGSPEQMLQGRAAGLNIVTSGSPGSESNIRIRGITSLGDNNPLVIVDGVQSSLFDINANDIESVQVLKDAGAAAIYGVRGSNGVIVVTTKTGKSASPKISYDGYVGTQRPPGGNVYHLLNTQEMADLTWKALINSNQVSSNGFPNHPQYGNGPQPVIPDYILVGDESGVSGTLTQETLDRYNIDYSKGSIFQITQANKQGTDWFHEIFKPAPVQSHSLSASSSSNKSSYFFSTGYYDQQGTLMNTYMKRYSVRANTVFNIKNNLRIGENLYVYYRDNPRTFTGIQNESDVSNPIMLSFLAQPIIPVFDIQGNYAGTRAKSLGQSPSPYAVADRSASYSNTAWVTQGNIFAEIDFLEHFQARSSFGGSFHNGYSHYFTARTYEDAENNPSNSYNEGAQLRRDWTFSNTINYHQRFGAHDVKALIGIEAMENFGRTVGGRSLGYFSTDPNYLTLTTGSNGFTNYSTIYNRTLFSQFGKLDYGFNDRYLLSATLRRDGSSRFGSKRRWGVFPAFSAGWRLSSESFLSELDWMNNFMLRASWGKLGNELNVNPSNAYSQFGSDLQNSYYDINGTSTNPIQGFYATRIGNSKTGWEEDVLANLGMDLTLFNRKLDLSLEYYSKSVNGLLFTDQSPATAGGATLPTVNIGNITNKGIDFNSAFHGSINEFQFDIGLNITHYKSEIADLPNTYFDTGSTRTGNFVRNHVGHPVGAFFGYQIEGLFRDEADVAASPSQDAAAPGRFKYADVNQDGKISADDRRFIGDPNPDFTYGLNLSAKFKGFDFSAFLYGSQGNDAVNYQKWWTDFYPSFQGAKSINLLYNSWRPDNLDAKTPIIENVSNFSNNAVPNSYYIENASFLKLKSLIIAYTIPQNALSKYGIERLRIYAQGANLFTITKYSGVDPELAGSGSAFGIDYGNYPNNQVNLNLGVNLTF